MKNTFLALTLFIATIANLSAQITEDSLPPKVIKPPYLRSISLQNYLDGNLKRSKVVDSSWKSYYSPFLTDSSLWASHSNYGSPGYDLYFRHQVSIDMPQLFPWTSPWSYSVQPNELIQARKRFTRLDYTQGARKFVKLKLNHTQNIKPHFNFNFDLNKSVTQGYLLNAGNAVSDYRLSGYYYIPKSIYRMTYSLGGNKLQMGENIGLLNQDEKVSGDLQSLGNPVRSSTAKSTYKNRFIELNQSLDFGKIQFQLKTNYYDEYRVYSDSRIGKNGFEFNYKDTLRTYDSLFSRRGIIKPVLVYEISDRWSVRFSNAYALSQVLMNDYKRSYAQSTAGIELNHTGEKLNTQIYFAEQYAGYANGNFELRLVLSGAEKGGLKNFSGGGAWVTSPVNQLYQYFQGNHHQWSANYRSIETRQGWLSWNNRIFRLKGQFDQIKNYVWIAEAERPYQDDCIFNIFQLSLEQNFSLGPIHYHHWINYAYGTRKQIMGIPDFMINQELRYGKEWKERKIGLDIAVRNRFFSEYLALKYMPDVGSFYRPLNQSIKAYAMLDFVITFRVSNAHVFFALEHFNSGFFPSYSNQGLPQYPSDVRNFKLGVKWDFWD